MELGHRITELEVQISYQAQTIEELNQVVISQQNQIDDLQNKLTGLVETIKSKSDSEPFDVLEEKPPHY